MGKLIFGLIFEFTGFGFFVIGVLLCTTGIGAIIGLPMIVVAAGLIIVGMVLVAKFFMSSQQRTIASGVSQGIQQARQAQQARPCQPYANPGSAAVRQVPQAPGQAQSR